jgi:hypothetical protein
MPEHAVTQPALQAGRLEILVARAQASQARAAQLRLLATRTVGVTKALCDELTAVADSAQGFSPTLLQNSRYARLLARLVTMPAIEQAKGIIMAQTGCSADDAFGMLRQASQRSNIPVRDLAERIIEKASGGSRAPETSGGRARLVTDTTPRPRHGRVQLPAGKGLDGNRRGSLMTGRRQ